MSGSYDRYCEQLTCFSVFHIKTLWLHLNNWMNKYLDCGITLESSFDSPADAPFCGRTEVSVCRSAGFGWCHSWRGWEVSTHSNKPVLRARAWKEHYWLVMQANLHLKKLILDSTMSISQLTTQNGLIREVVLSGLIFLR